MTEQPYSQKSRVDSLEFKVTAILPSLEASAPTEAQARDLHIEYLGLGEVLSKKQYQTISSYQSDTKLQRKSNTMFKPIRM